MLFKAIKNSKYIYEIRVISSDFGVYFDYKKVYDPTFGYGSAGAVIGCSIAVGVLLIIIALVTCYVNNTKRLRKMRNEITP